MTDSGCGDSQVVVVESKFVSGHPAPRDSLLRAEMSNDGGLQTSVLGRREVIKFIRSLRFHCCTFQDRIDLAKANPSRVQKK